jgi:hypothetical protein
VHELLLQGGYELKAQIDTFTSFFVWPSVLAAGEARGGEYASEGLGIGVVGCRNPSD